MKNVSIPYELFCKLVKYHVGGIADQESGEAIKAALIAKVDAMERRDAYTQSKIAETPEAREAARLKYLDLAGIHEDFRK